MTIKSNHTDEQLMSFLQKGNESAFNEIYKRYGKRIFYFTYKQLNNKDLAADFTQDVFVKVIEHAHSFDCSKSFKTWIFTLTSNALKNYYRSNKTYIDEPEVYFETLHSNDEEEHIMENEAIRKMVQVEIDALKSPYKETFFLRYNENLKIKEIAQIMNCPEGTIKSRLNYGMSVISQKLNYLVSE